MTDAEQPATLNWGDSEPDPVEEPAPAPAPQPAASGLSGPRSGGTGGYVPPHMRNGGAGSLLTCLC